ncbi:hypothetical protein [Roseibium sp. RKSG952]|uniref:hypothetical protein n=1 Tax=Roseibium sp. RKSG952 TaxID=2529384 RepID=UPI0012BBF012|nr:hypothetical protein [Roseibium sp. RKSG952]MTH95248.1 hypothetical protein [Roseibium sp. RKSG952]
MTTYARTNNDEAIEFRFECVGAHHGQLDLNLLALINGEYCGIIKFSEFEQKPSVSWMEVLEIRKREGIGRAMVLELQSQYPETEIDFGMLTEDGLALLRSLPSIEIETAPERSKLEAQLLSLRSRETRCQAACDQYHDLPAEVQDSETTRLELSRVLKTWESVRDEINELQTSISSFPPPQRILLAPEAKLVSAPGM